MILYCVRHGESTYNAESRIQGQSDVPLSETGRRQSAAIAHALADVPIEAVYASPLQRAFQTAEAIAAVRGLTIRTDPRLMEIGLGVFEGKLRRELGELYPEEFARWTSGDPDFAVPGGESRRDLARRGSAALVEILQAGHAHVALVAHGRLLLETFRALLGPDGNRVLSPLQNGSITTLETTADGRLTLLAADEVGHLRDAGLTGGVDL